MNGPRREKEGVSASARRAGAGRAAGLGRVHWASLAGSILGGALVGALLWSGGSRGPLGPVVLEHVVAEPEALADATPLGAAAIAELLERDGVRLLPGSGPVTHASRCRLRGHPAVHLVLQAEGGPVTLLVLRHERVDAPVSFAGDGFSGRIVPNGPGSLAVVGASGADLDRIAARMQAAVEWLR
jgi:hypothetical protein